MASKEPKILSLEEVRARLKEKSVILWAHREDIESGSVTCVSESFVDVCWLEGYKTRNDAVRFDEVLSIRDGRAPEVRLGDWAGHGYLTEAGMHWKQAHEAQSAHA